jgi:hypothetical protein
MVQQVLFCDVEWYVKSKNLAFRLLHIFSVAPTQLQALGLVNPNIQFAYEFHLAAQSGNHCDIQELLHSSHLPHHLGCKKT